MNSNILVDREHRTENYSMRALRLLIELAIICTKGYGLPLAATAEFLATVSLILDNAIDLKIGDAPIHPLLGFQLFGECDSQDVLLVPEFTDWHGKVYPLVKLMRDRPELFRIENQSMSERDLKEIFEEMKAPREPI